MMDMVERVARALALADLDPETRAIVNLDAHMEHVREHYSGLARAAIEAMREPTVEMVEAAVAPYRDGNTEQFNRIMRHTVTGYHQAMIDAALTSAHAPIG